MSLEFTPLSSDGPLGNVAVFLAASIPNPERWQGYFDAREITDAVVAAARTVLTAGGVLVTGAHPTIAPLLLYVAAEFPIDPNRPRVLVYQSALFESVMPPATKRFEEDGVGSLRITEAVSGERPEYGSWNGSLRIMRERMFSETAPRAGIYVGGMQDISREFQLLRNREPTAWPYPLAKPGGEAARLVEFAPESVRQVLSESNIYPTVFRKVVEDLASRLREER